MRKGTNALDLIRLKSIELQRRRERRGDGHRKREREGEGGGEKGSINRSCADWPESIDAD